MQTKCVVLLAGCLFICAAAFAQNNRSAVASTGLDTNGCTVISPCRSFGVAIAHTNPGGEIIALDTAGYGPFSINQAITVSGAPGIHAAITVTTGTGVSVAAGSNDRVVLRNLVVIGAGGLSAIYATFGSELQIVGCRTSGFTNGEIVIADVAFIIDHCAVIDGTGNSSLGIWVQHNQVGPITRGTIVNTLVDAQWVGILAGEGTAVVVSNSTITNCNAGAEAVVSSAQGTGNADLTVDNCTIAHNNYGVFAGNQGQGSANIYLDADVIAFNVNPATPGTGVIYSFGNNAFSGNTNAGGPFSPIGLQ
jgi:hypothetical protein